MSSRRPWTAKRAMRTTILAGFMASQIIPTAVAQPSGGNVVAGQGSISQNGTLTQINQSSNRLIIEWDSFDTSAQDTVRFVQPGRDAMALNRVLSGQATRFDGSLFANGNVIIVNGAGIHFGPNALVDVGGLIASTSDITNSNFLSDRFVFDQPGLSDAMVTNAGTITARDAGLAALVGPGVENSGLIRAELGTVVLASGEAHTIDFRGDGLISFAVTSPTTTAPRREDGSEAEALVENSGTVQADGGSVVMTASQASRVLDTAINMTGVAQANSVGVRNGRIVLGGGSAGRVRVSGQVSARGETAGTRGGTVHVTGEEIATEAATIDVSGVDGGGNALIGGAERNQALDPSSDVAYVQTGDLLTILIGENAGAAGDGVMPLASRTTIDADTHIDASSSQGNGGEVIVWGRDDIRFLGNINTLGGEDGFVEVSGFGTGLIGGLARTGHMLIDPQDVCVGNGDGNVCGGSLTSPIEILGSTIATALSNGTDYTINTTNATGGGTGRVLFENLVIQVNNTTNTNTGTFTIEAADSIDLGETSFSVAVGSNTGANYVFTAGTTAGGSPANPRADIDMGGQVVATGGGYVRLEAADDVLITDPLITSGGNVTIIANGTSDTSTVRFFEDDGRIQTTDGNGGAGEVLIIADNIVFGSIDITQPVINANGTGGAVTFEPLTSGRTINLGTTTASSLSLTDDMLDRIAAETLRFGSADTGNITISAAISPAQVSTLSLITGAGGILDGNNTGNDITVTNLALQSAGGILGLETSVSGLSFNNGINGVLINNTGAVTITSLDGSPSSSSNSDVAIQASEITADVDVDVTGNLTLTAPTVNLDANLEASGFILGSATTVNVLGSAGGAEIDDAIDLAVSGAAISIDAGSYDSFIVDLANLTISGVGATTIINAASPAITIAANGTIVQNMLLQGTGTADDVGVLLDGIAAADLTGVQIINVDLSNLDNGILSQGDIGDGVAANVDVTIRGTSAADAAIFEDFLDAAIDVGDTADGDAVYLVQDVIVRDGATDADAIATGSDGLRFGTIAAATVNRVDISGTANDGIEFSALDDADILVSNSSISGGQHGILFGGAITGATTLIDIANNSLIEGANQGIVFIRDITDATVRIRGNGSDATNGIRGVNDAIAVNSNPNVATITNATFIIGGDSAIDGNFIVSPDQAIDIDAISGGRFVIANNDLLQGSSGAIEFEQTISNNAEIVIANNGDVRGGGGAGIVFRDDVTGADVTIGGNTFTTGSDAIRFNTVDLDANANAITDATIVIGSASDVTVDQTTVDLAGNVMAGGGGTDGGIDVQAAVAGDTDFTIANNTIGNSASRVGGNGIEFRSGILDTATVTLTDNQVFATGRAIRIFDLQSPSTVSIVGGTYNGTGGALLVDNTGQAGTNGRLVLGSAAYVGGASSTVLEVLTDTGNAGVLLDFSGTATFTGGATGISLSGPGIDVLNDTFGSIAFSSQTGNYITLANGAEFLPGSPTILDATGVSFDGKLASAMTSAELFAVEDKMLHFPDDATLGLIDIATLFVVQGESIQTAVNAAGLLVGPQTVTVGGGTFGGSVEVWVDNLTLTGRGSATIIDTDTIDLFANNGDVDNGFQVAAISGLSGGGDVTGVTIQNFAFDTVSSASSNIGIELGEATSPTSTAINTTITNNTFNDLVIGLRSDLSSGTTTITGNTMTGVSNGINFNDAIVAGEVVTITGNNVSSLAVSSGFFSDVTGANILVSGNTLTSSGGNALAFSGTITDSTVTIGGVTNADANTIIAGGTGINVAGAVTGTTTFQITDNNIGSAGTRVGGDGIALLGGVLGTATVTLTGNQVFATGQAIQIDDLQSPSTVSITSGTYNGTGGALLVDNTGVAGTNGRLNLGSAAYVGGAGSTVLEVLTDTGNAGVILDFSGTATFTGGTTGIRLSGPGIDVINNTLGSIAFSGQTGDYMTLANGAEFLPGSPTIIDATGVSFDGVLGSALTVTQAFAVENKLTHYLDDPTLGLLNFGQLVVPNGNSIQLAVNAAGFLGGPRTVTVGAGTFGGSVEVWVDDLTLVGQGGVNTVIDTLAVDPFANNGDADNGFQVAAVSALSGLGDVTGVTIQDFFFDSATNAATNLEAGIELGNTAGANSTAINTTVTNNVFNDMPFGVLSQLSGGTTAITSNSMTSIGNGIIFQDAVVAGETVTITGNTINTLGPALAFSSTVTNANIVISGNSRLTSFANSGVVFSDTITDSMVTIGGALAADANDISGSTDGIYVSAISGGTFTIANNTSIFGRNSDGIEFNGAIGSNATIQITGNGFIDGGANGIAFLNSITDSTVMIGGTTAADANTIIAGGTGINVAGTITNTTTGTTIFDVIGNTIGDATGGVIGNNGILFNTITNTNADPDALIITIAGNTIGGLDTGGNSLLRTDGIRFNSTLTDATVLIGGSGDGDANTIIGGVDTSTDNGIYVDTDVNGGRFLVVGNTRISGFFGLYFAESITNAEIVVAGNGGDATGEGIFGLGSFGDAVVFDDTITGTNVTIGTATVTVDGETMTFGGNSRLVGQADGIDVAAISGSRFLVIGNTLIQGESAGAGIEFEDDITNNAVIEILGNTTISGADHGIEFGDFDNQFFTAPVTSSTVTIAGNEIVGLGSSGGGDGIWFGSALTDATVLIGAAQVDVDGDGAIQNDEIFAGNTIRAARNGINVEGAVTANTGTSTFTIASNPLIRGGNNGVIFQNTITSSTVAITSNTEIRGVGVNGIAFNTITDSVMDITSNTGIYGDGFDGIFVEGALTRSIFATRANTDIVGNRDGVFFQGNVVGSLADISSNSRILGGRNGINIAVVDPFAPVPFFNDLVGSNLSIRNNGLVRGTNFFGVAVSTMSAQSNLDVLDNTEIRGGAHGIAIREARDSMIGIVGNTGIYGNVLDGIFVQNGLADTTFTIDTNGEIVGARNGITVDGFGGGVAFSVDQSSVLGGQTGLAVTGSNTGGGQSIIVLSESPFEGQADPGISITTQAGGSAITTVFEDGVVATGSPSLAMSGPNQAIAGNSIANVTFNSVGGGNFIVLSNGALFEPGRPTIITGTGATFDGVVITPNVEQGTIDWVESRIIDFDDNPALGQIFFFYLPNLFDTGFDGPVRMTNAQTPGDWILRPDFNFHILATNPLFGDYGLGGCLLEVSDTGGLFIPQCIAPAGGTDPSPSIQQFMEGMEELSALQ